MVIVRQAITLQILCILLINLNGCLNHANDIVVAEIGPEKMSVTEFERLLVKNNGGWEAAKNTPMPEKEKFLDLVVKFRLKLLGAYRHGLDKDPDIVRELQEYSTSLAASFFLEREVVKPGLRQMYERRKEEVKASHILIALPPNPTPRDTLAAWQKAADLIERARRGEDFASLARQFSEDYSSRENGGSVYYFTSGFMVPPFEDACYQLKSGETFPQPVRSEFGYHVIKLTDRKPSRGQIRASHIMMRFETSTPTPEDTLKAYNEIKALQESLTAGRDFAELAKSHSQDVGSAQQGGDLGFFERRRAVQPFDEAAFSLKVGEVSGIVRTPYGYHLIKLTEEKPISPYRELKQSLRELYQNYRYTYDYESFLRRYKADVNFTVYSDIADTLLSRVDSTKLFSDSSWDQNISATVRGRPAFSFATESASLDSVIRVMKNDPEFNKMELKVENVRKALDRVAERLLIRHRTRNIQEEFPEFKLTLKEYEEGILLYKSEQQQVWSKISATDSLLHDYFEKNRERYKLLDRVRFSEVLILGDSSKALQFLDSLKAGVDFNEFAARRSDRPKSRQNKGEWGLRPLDENELTRKAATMEVGEISKPIRFEGGYSIIKVTAKEKARLKSYEEAAPEVGGHYHDYVSNRLEEQWLNTLRQEFKVRLQPENLSAAFAEPPRDKEE